MCEVHLNAELTTDHRTTGPLSKQEASGDRETRRHGEPENRRTGEPETRGQGNTEIRGNGESVHRVRNSTTDHKTTDHKTTGLWISD